MKPRPPGTGGEQRVSITRLFVGGSIFTSSVRQQVWTFIRHGAVTDAGFSYPLIFISNAVYNRCENVSGGFGDSPTRFTKLPRGVDPTTCLILEQKARLMKQPQI